MIIENIWRGSGLQDPSHSHRATTRKEWQQTVHMALYTNGLQNIYQRATKPMANDDDRPSDSGKNAREETRPAKGDNHSPGRMEYFVSGD